MDACAARDGMARDGTPRGADGSGGGSSDARICWFCSKGRHNDCMGQIPVQGATDGGPHDCAFDTRLVGCRCCQMAHRLRV